MKSPAYNICEILSSAGLGTLGVDLFYSDLPATISGTIVGIFDTGGYPPDDNALLENFNPTVMARIKGRRDNYQQAYDKAYSIFSTLNGQHNVSVTDFRIILISALSDILWIGYDDDNRPEFTINFLAMRTPLS